MRQRIEAPRRSTRRGALLLPPGLAEHPVAALNQGVLLPMLDAHLAGLFSDPAALASAMTEDRAEPSMEALALGRQAAELRKEVANLVGVLSSGVVSDAVTEALTSKEAQLRHVEHQLAGLDHGRSLSTSPGSRTTSRRSVVRSEC